MLSEEDKAEHRRLSRLATARALAVVRGGDRISRRLCGGATGTFTFTHWDGLWLSGATVSDCSARNVFKINGRAVDFASDDHLPTDWKTLEQYEAEIRRRRQDREKPWLARDIIPF